MLLPLETKDAKILTLEHTVICNESVTSESDKLSDEVSNEVIHLWKHFLLFILITTFIACLSHLGLRYVMENESIKLTGWGTH